MPRVANYAAGTPSWADLLCHDGHGAKDFYCCLFGWEYEDNPVDENMMYTIITQGGLPVCASEEAWPGTEQENLPAHWSVYVTVDDLEGTTERTRDAGGTVIAEPFDVFDVGRMSLIQDPQKA